MRSSLFCDIAQGRLVVTDVSGQPIGPIFDGPAVQEVRSSGMLTQRRLVVIAVPKRR